MALHWPPLYTIMIAKEMEKEKKQIVDNQEKNEQILLCFFEEIYAIAEMYKL